MVTHPVAVMLRFDTEDFLTPESDDAALYLARTLERHGLRATFPITAWKVEALVRRGRRDVLQALQRHAVGYHSSSHSVHPTIAEELAATSDEAAEEQFSRREEPGFRLVTDHLGADLCAYTQPGGNWVAEAATALRAWRVPLYFSEGWNSYIDVEGRPFFLGGVLSYAGEVAAPKPFLSRLPESLEGAEAQLLDAIRRERERGFGSIGLVNVVSHPTELVTESFWDQTNFAAGRNRPESAWTPPPLRSPDMVARAKDAFDGWIRTLVSSGAEVWTAQQLVAAFPDAAVGETFGIAESRAIATAWADGAVGSVAVRGIPLTAAEALTILARVSCALGRREEQVQVTAFAPLPPWGASSAASAPGGALSYAAVLEAAQALEDEGRLPALLSVEGRTLSLLDMAAALARAFLHRLEDGPSIGAFSLTDSSFLTARYVKPVEQLHWDWPIFPKDFRPERLRRRAVDATWTLKPAEAALCDHQV